MERLVEAKGSGRLVAAKNCTAHDDSAGGLCDLFQDADFYLGFLVGGGIVAGIAVFFILLL